MTLDELRARIEALPAWTEDDWVDDGLGGSEHRNIEAVDRAAVLALLDEAGDAARVLQEARG